MNSLLLTMVLVCQLPTPNAQLPRNAFLGVGNWEFSQIPQQRPGRSAIQGLIADGDGRPVGGAEVVLKTGTRDVARTVTSADGVFRFLDVAPGEYLLTICWRLVVAAFGTCAVIGAIGAQQVADTTFRPPIERPAYPVGSGPVVQIDEAHHNFHTATGRYLPFSELVRRTRTFANGRNKQSSRSEEAVIDRWRRVSRVSGVRYPHGRWPATAAGV